MNSDPASSDDRTKLGSPLSASVDTDGMPTRRVRLLLSVFLVFQLFALSVSLLAVVGPSTTHAWVLARLSPYLRATRFGVDDRPIYLAYGNRTEQALRLQVSDSDPTDSSAWQSIEPPGLPGMAANDRYRRWLASVVLLAERGQPGLVAELLLPLAVRDKSIRSIRIIRLPNDLSAVVDDAEIPPYTARVVRKDDSVSLLHVPIPSQSSVAIQEQGGQR